MYIPQGAVWLERQLQYRVDSGIATTKGGCMIPTSTSNQMLRRSLMTDFTPTVFIVDDDVSVRESLELLVRCAGWRPEAFASAQEFLAHSRAHVPSCLVLDIALPGISGLELQKCMAHDRIDMPIIFLTGSYDVPMTVQAMKAGAQEFLTKPFDDEVLLNAIGQAIERSRAALSREAEARELRARHSTLTMRERQVLSLVVSGMLNKQVGGELGISEITVKAHRGKVMQKMKADSLPDLVRMAARLRVIPAPAPMLRRPEELFVPLKRGPATDASEWQAGRYIQ
ncbi:MAG: response regulator transcription factor [Terracidiphilus sp.]|jgi:FixJ family two-component response regulator